MAGMQCYFRQAVEKIHLLVRKHISMGHHLQTSELRLSGLISGTVEQAVLQNELDKVKQHWNTHRIRRSGHGTVPGVPDVLFYLPDRSSAVDCKWVLQSRTIDEMEQHLNVENNDDEANIYQEYFHYVMNHQSLQLPSSIEISM
ncbi:hypothetical protein OS493_008970 [Desmophyllum pertusum]|uniref:Uncharacterized protein n=1 Tax=Desmophyllum pertusum TaxID=174260 RepID=A0A9W9ZF40_9CNID|nr:hypothetical protein OS493_008970 [Desmophyllum pertusum]